jgi:hypothetical protein
MDILYIDKCRYEILEQKGVSVWYTGIYLPNNTNTSSLKSF